MLMQFVCWCLCGTVTWSSRCVCVLVSVRLPEVHDACVLVSVRLPEVHNAQVSVWLPEVHSACVCILVSVWLPQSSRCVCVLVSVQLPEVHDACVCVGVCAVTWCSRCACVCWWCVVTWSSRCVCVCWCFCGYLKFTMRVCVDGVWLPKVHNARVCVGVYICVVQCDMCSKLCYTACCNCVSG